MTRPTRFPRLFILIILVISPVLLAHPSPTVAVPPSLRVLAPTSPLLSFPNIPIVGEGPPDRQQAEPTIAVDPRNPNIIIAGAQDYRLKEVGEHRWHGYYRSVDGGATWTNSLLPGYPGDTTPDGLASILHQSNATSDPVLTFDSQGNVYYAGLVFNVTGPTTSGMPVAFVAKYTNDGAVYSGVTLIPGTVFADKPWIAVDTSNGPNRGTVYVAVDAQLQSSSSIIASVLSMSIDGGRTYSKPFYAPSDQSGMLPGVTVDGSGRVYISTVRVDPSTGRVLNRIQVTKMIPGGTIQVLNVDAVAFFVPLNNTIPGASFRNTTIPQITADGNSVYLVWDDLSTGNSNVYFARSIDAGASWTGPKRVNDSAIGQHFFPTVAVSTGIVSVAWYDSRLNNDTQSISSLDVYYAYSRDNGVSFSSNSRISSVSFNPNSVLRSDPPDQDGYFLGDYIGIAASPVAAHVIWTDNRFACDTSDLTFGCLDQDAFTARINLQDFTVSSSSPSSIVLGQGENGTIGVVLSNPSFLDSNVTLTVESLPSGLPIDPSVQNLTLPAGSMKLLTITVSPSSSTSPQTFNLNITASSPYTRHSVLVNVTVESVLVKAASTLANQIKALFNRATPFVLSIIIFALIVIGLFHRPRKTRTA